MTNIQPDTIVYIGRFQPAHKAHIETIKRALSIAKKRVIILVGSANQPRTTKNPWKWDERAQMILDSLPEKMRPRVTILPLRDTVYLEAEWIKRVQEAVYSVAADDEVINIIGYTKDESSYYIESFPQWDTIEMENMDDLHATDIRNAMFEDQNFDENIGVHLPKGIHDYIKSYMLTTEYDNLVEEYQFNQKHDRAWDMDKMLDYFLEQEGHDFTPKELAAVENAVHLLKSKYRVAPYKPTFNTVDMIVIKSGHVLLVRRRAQPGKGLYAIPGGYLDPKEWSKDGAMRELKEEARIDEAPAVIRSNIKADHVFEHPERSIRGRLITHAYIVELPPGGPLPKVRGASDAEKAKWVPLSVFEKMEDQMFEDHYHIIKYMLAKLPKE
jgi:bifunctional NMN adenylyltransferase/nudix hydrolase